MQSNSTSPWLPHITGSRNSTDRRPALMGIFPGEGVGPELIAAAISILDALESVHPLNITRRYGGPIGLAAHKNGELIPDTSQFCQAIFQAGGALFCGPGGGRFVYDLRKHFDLFCKIAPLKPAEALLNAGRLKPTLLRGVDILIVRDNAGGIYQGSWNQRDCPDNGRIAEHTFSYTQPQVRRIVEAAARLAHARRGRMDVIIKDGGVPAISDLWRAEAQRAAAALNIESSCLNADYAAYRLIQEPRSFDVVVTPNMLGDILADLGAVLLGSRGLSYSGNFSSDGRAVYQTGHGAAYDLAGTDRANPAAQILALAMMLRESYALDDQAALIEQALHNVWTAGWRTDDLAEPGTRRAGTREFADLVVQAVTTLCQTQAVA